MIKDFKALKISIASPQDILSWSHGEVKKAETINYRTFKPEPQGLMAEEIFGPSKNFECYCGKYKKVRYKGIVCDRCGVEVTHKRVRRERMGHIQLSAPVTHVWFANGIPNKLALILDIPAKKLETVIYYARYVVTSIEQEGKDAALESIPALKLAEIEEIANEFKEKEQEVEDNFAQEVKELKKTVKEEKKLDMKLAKVDKNKAEELARLKAAQKQRVDALDAKYIEIKSLVESIDIGATLSEEEYQLLESNDMYFYNASMGAEALKELLVQIDLDAEISRIEEELANTKTELKKARFVQRLRILKGMRKANIRPDWIVMDVLPVIPPDLRPIVQLPGGRFATYDLNDLYRRVVNRNNRLNRLIQLGAPEIILRNEKRMLQESVDALLDNNHKPGAPSLSSKGVPYKSLSDMLRGKQGRFRQNLLGKRVDYSGNAVIIPGPELKFDECGLPKAIALELFKPFILRELISQGFAANPNRAKIIFEEKEDVVFDILEQVIQGRPVLLNRAPSLHKQSILAFYPVLIEGNAIRLHPMTCTGFNADFDGDQMAVHLPLSDAAVEEAKSKMFARHNMLNLRDGTPIVNVQKDMAFGVYFLTKMKGDEASPVGIFSSVDDLISNYYLGNLSFYKPVKLLVGTEVIVTTAGRALFNQILPADYGFINKPMNKSDIAKLASDLFVKYGSDIAIEVLDNIKNLGFKYAGRYGLSISMEEFKFETKNLVENKLNEFDKVFDTLAEDYREGFITENEVRRLQREAWVEYSTGIQDQIWEIAKDQTENLIDLQTSGSVPVKEWLKKISGVNGFVTDPTGNVVDLPIKNNFEKGLSNFEYFVAARGARKGFADVALRTADSGYLTRRLHEAAQDIITIEEDCGTNNGIKLMKSEKRAMSYANRIKGRILTQDAVSADGKKTYAKAGEMLSKSVAEEIAQDETVDYVEVRSPLTCQTSHGVCAKCYGSDNGTGDLVELGIAVGTVASQSLGEPTTQLTLKSKSDARAAKTDVTQGLPRVEELIEVRTPKTQSILSEISGVVSVVNQKGHVLVRVNGEVEGTESLDITDAELKVKDGDQVGQGEILGKKGKKEIVAPFSGVVKIDANNLVISGKIQEEVEYEVDNIINVMVKEGAIVEKGDPLTYGSIDPKELASLKSILSAQKYVITEAQSVYGNNGLEVDDRHLEIILRQMSRFGLITDGGGSENYFPGDYVDVLDIKSENESLKAAGKSEISFKQVIMGISNAAIRTESFLAAASFEQQVKVLTEASLVGKIDLLRGLKENVIIGKPIPLAGVKQNKQIQIEKEVII